MHSNQMALHLSLLLYNPLLLSPPCPGLFLPFLILLPLPTCVTAPMLRLCHRIRTLLTFRLPAEANPNWLPATVIWKSGLCFSLLISASSVASLFRITANQIMYVHPVLPSATKSVTSSLSTVGSKPILMGSKTATFMSLASFLTNRT